MALRTIEWPPHRLRRIPLGFVPPVSASELILTEEQRFVADRLALAHRAHVLGCSGSGKTHLAASYAKGLGAMGRRVLLLSPRKPLAVWLRQALEQYGVLVQTIDACMRAALRTRWTQPPQRLMFDDRNYFEAAIESVEPNFFDVVIVEEWQTTSELERCFVSALCGAKAFVALDDPTRELHDFGSRAVRDAQTLKLSEGFRSPEGVSALDCLYAADGLDPLPTSRAATCVVVSELEGPDDFQGGILAALEGFRRRGFALGEVGVVSGHARARSPVVTAMVSSRPGVRGHLLTTGPALTGLACDSFSYWMGLERRALILAEFPGGLPGRRKKFHIGLSRACEEVHILALHAEVEADPCLAEWIRETRCLR